MYHTYARPSRDLRNHYAEIVKLIQNHDRVIITHNGKDESVLISTEEFREYEDFIQRQHIAEKLAQAKAEASDPSTPWLSHDDVWRDLRSKHGL
jgi:prevent-host-death family protein